jgi:hypothetical protein
MSDIFLICFPDGGLKYRTVHFKNGRVTSQAIDGEDWRHRIEELWSSGS